LLDIAIFLPDNTALNVVYKKEFLRCILR